MVTPAFWAWARLLGGAGILGLLVWRLGSGAFLDGLRVIDGGTLLAAAGIGLLTTVFSAWRWCLVARGLGIPLPLRGAVADYYRALFLNAALPGGVLGDVHRAVRHGKDVDDVGRGVRAVVLERAAGQVVLVAVGVTALLASPLPVRLATRFGPVPPIVAAGFGAVLLAAAGLAIGLLVRRRTRALRLRRHLADSGAPQSAPLSGASQSAPLSGAPLSGGSVSGAPLSGGTSRWGRAWRAGLAEVRAGLLSRRNLPGIVLASTVVLAGHLATFVVAARAVGVSAPITQLAPLALLALLAMTVPVNVGGWGPREGVTAWAFGAVGLTASAGLTIAVVYGLLAFVASLPGAVVLVVRWLGRRRAARRPAGSDPIAVPSAAVVAGDAGRVRPIGRRLVGTVRLAARQRVDADREPPRPVVRRQVEREAVRPLGRRPAGTGREVVRRAVPRLRPAPRPPVGQLSPNRSESA